MYNLYTNVKIHKIKTKSNKSRQMYTFTDLITPFPSHASFRVWSQTIIFMLVGQIGTRNNVSQSTDRSLFVFSQFRSLTICPSIHLSFRPSVCPQCIQLSINQFVWPSIWPFFYLPTSVFGPHRYSVCLSVSLHLSAHLSISVSQVVIHMIPHPGLWLTAT